MLERPPQLLSAGERRRVAVAAMLASHPKALLLDEPTAGQDPRPRHLTPPAKRMRRDGVAVALATRDLAWAYSLRNAGPYWPMAESQQTSNPAAI